MKIDRLIGILSVLLQKEQTTAPELAEQFEVSRRTICRDIDDLCRAGIPVITSQGAGGGIRIMEGYCLDKTILTSKDMRMILAGLRSLDSVSGTDTYRQLMEKIQAGSSRLVSGRDSLLVDLSSWQKGSLVPKIEIIQDAVEQRKLLAFRYTAPGGESSRLIEPYYIIFKWAGWYVWGWCRNRQAYRLFKLDRMDRVTLTPEGFIHRHPPLPDLSEDSLFPGRVHVSALFAADVKWRLAEAAGADSFRETENGRLLFEGEYSDEDSFIMWILTFGNKAEILMPETARKKIASVLREAAGQYGEG